MSTSGVLVVGHGGSQRNGEGFASVGGTSKHEERGLRVSMEASHGRGLRF